MQRKTLLTLCAAAVVATSALGVATARAAKPASLIASITWKGTTDRDWNTAGNWSGSTVPDAGDTVTIPLTEPEGYQGDPIISNADGLAGDLTIARTRTVTVTGKKLTLDGNTQTFTGTLILSNSTSKVEFTYPQATDWVGLSGSGGIKGEHASAEVRLNDSKIDSDIVIHGMMIVKEVGGTATFKNGDSGKVLANDDGVLLFEAGLTLESESGSSFEAKSNSNAVLQFKQAATTNMEADFAVANCSTLKFDATIGTDGAFDIGAAVGFVDVDAGNSVEFRYDCVGGCTVIDSDQTYGGC